MKQEKLRTKNFKLGEFHGKLNPEKSDSEAKMQNDIFLVGKIGLMHTLKDITEIKLIAKEMPLMGDVSRGRCIDLFGIDKNWTPYIIELKLGSNTELLAKVVKQVTDYSLLFDKIKARIEIEMREKTILQGIQV